MGSTQHPFCAGHSKNMQSNSQRRSEYASSLTDVMQSRVKTEQAIRYAEMRWNKNKITQMSRAWQCEKHTEYINVNSVYANRVNRAKLNNNLVC